MGGSTTAVYSGRLWRPRRRGSRVDKHQINFKVHSVHRIFRAIFFFFAIVKKFVEKTNWWSRAGGVTTPKTPPGSAPGSAVVTTVS